MSDSHGSDWQDEQSESESCPFCHNFDPKTAGGSRSMGAVPGVLVDLREVTSRASEGCRSCEIIEKALTELDPEWQAKIDYSAGECRGAEVHGWLGLQDPYNCTCDMFRLVSLENGVSITYPCGEFGEDVSGSKGASLELFVKEGVPRSMDEIDITNYERASKGLSERLEVVSDWIDECSLHHECDMFHQPRTKKQLKKWRLKRKPEVKLVDPLAPVGSRKPTTLPPRVLDLRLYASEGRLRLYDTAGSKGTYACLSYCWGAKNPCVTTRDTLASNVDDIPWSSLPQTYRDAIQVTSTLGISFLWIDALCIIQGDLKDWEYHSAEMANIYGNSIVVIAAVDASDVTQGFLRSPRTVSDIFALETSSYTPGSESLKVYARKTLDHIWLGHNSWDNMDKIGQIPLWSRAWCLQEEVLAPRLLSFYGDDIFFQCRANNFRCECNFRPGPEIVDTTAELTPLKAVLGTCLDTNKSETPNAEWQTIIHNYSRRHLTVPTDKLPALSGVARIAQQTYKAEYLAGHWKDETFFQSLCWDSLEKMNDADGQGKFVAPSWSWMAFRGRISRNNPVHDDYKVAKGTKLLSYETKLSSQDPTGALLDGYLVVRGAFLDVRIEETEEGGLVMWRNEQPNEVTLDTNHIEIKDKEHSVACWLVAMSGSDTPDDDDYECYFSVVLRRIGREQGKPVYRRIGYADAWGYPKSPQRAFFNGWNKSMKVAIIR